MIAVIDSSKKLSLEEFLTLPETKPYSEYFNGEIQAKPMPQFNISPDWLIEILSPEQSTTKVIKKILFAIKKGTQLGWIIDPDDESVMIFKPDQFPEIKSEDEDLPVLEALGNWQLKVSDLWAWLTV